MKAFMNFEFTKSKVKVTRVIFVINYVKQFPFNILKTIDYITFITHKVQIV